MSGPPADQPYTWTDPATGKTYYLQSGRYYDVSGQPYQAAPDPYQGWLGSDAGSRSWRYIGDTDKTFYEDNPSQLYQQYLTDEFGGRRTPLAEYAGNQYGRYYADYLKWSEGDKSGQRTFGDTLTNNLAQQIRDSFTLQSPTQKGYALMFQPGGRVTGF